MATEHDYPFEVMVGIPWRSQPTRVPAFEVTRRWWEERGFTVVTADTLHVPFNLAAARNKLVRESRAVVVVLCDADTVPEDEAIREAVYAAAADGLVHLPYHLYRTASGEFVDGAHSGVYVTTPAAWAKTNGQDEGFQGWGYEDNAWRLAHTTLVGPIPRHAGTVVAANHAPASRDHVSRNRARYRLYQDAYGNPERMQALVDGRGPVPLTPAEEAEAARQARRARMGKPLG